MIGRIWLHNIWWIVNVLGKQYWMRTRKTLIVTVGGLYKCYCSGTNLSSVWLILHWMMWSMGWKLWNLWY